MRPIKGKALMVKMNGQTVALATNCSFEASLNTIDARTKDDDGAYDIPDHITFTITTEHLMGAARGTGQQTYATLMERFIAKRPVDVELMIAGNAEGAIPEVDWSPGAMLARGFLPVGGAALIKSISVNGPLDGNATFSVALQGRGALVNRSDKVTARVENNTLIIDGPAEVINGILVADGELTVTNNTLKI